MVCSVKFSQVFWLNIATLYLIEIVMLAQYETADPLSSFSFIVFFCCFILVCIWSIETAANATVLTITSFTVERYLAICHPFLQHTMSKLSRAVKLIICVWIVSISLAIPQALQFGVVTSPHGIAQCTLKRIIIEHSFELSTVLFFLTPMTLITILYILIGLKLRTSGMIKHGHGTHQRVQVNPKCRQQQTSVGTRRVIKMLGEYTLDIFIEIITILFVHIL